jgi:hypothetical protein
MGLDLEAQLERLPQMNREALRALWKELFGGLPNQKLRREILIPILAYRLQEGTLGGLTPAVAKRLRAIAEEISLGVRPAPSSAQSLKAGARIIREWQGKLYEVAAVEKGFEYNGRKFTSLSEIAREITGTRWSGPAFFRLKKRSPMKAA